LRAALAFMSVHRWFSLPVKPVKMVLTDRSDYDTIPPSF
jgi:hypothetical protein